ncbi:MAG: hypothetical protein JW993_10190 [Sedimentisphaerales bacterium]|nr:hypothetical protein [Sedimentisphaerales bacterium]
MIVLVLVGVWCFVMGAVAVLAVQVWLEARRSEQRRRQGLRLLVFTSVKPPANKPQSSKPSGGVPPDLIDPDTGCLRDYR